MGDLLFLRPRAAAVSLLLLLLLSSPWEAVAGARPRRRYDSIFAFGDSYTDTGNNPVAFSWYNVPNPVMRPPYGSTFFGSPTGRSCDGRLVIDFIAESLGLPLLPPFLQARNGTTTTASSSSFRHGANFAVGAATAIDASFFHRWDAPGGGGGPLPLNTSLAVQLHWFESLKPSLCATPKECELLFGRSLFFVGELGFNDYGFYLSRGKTVQHMRSLLPDVINAISMAIERLIKHGATSLVVSGTVPAGCEPPILAYFAGADQASYNPRTGCLNVMNDLSTHHNSLLHESLERIRARHPDVTIIDADFFNPVLEMVESPGKFGFEEDALIVCCGGPGRYHFNDAILCGDSGSTTCQDPSARLFWDGAHFTEAANRIIADEWLSSMNSPASDSS